MNIREQLKRDEGTVNHAYEDSLGFLTIGVGRLIDVRRGGGLSPEEVDLLLTNDIAEKTKAVLEALPWAASLNEPRLAVLINMAFQLGLHGLLQFKHTLSEVEKGHYGIAAAMMLDSKWEKQTPTRAHRLADQMESGEWV
jgi:lysozyme